MSLPPLYKYLDPSGAKLTLENGTFRHAKPSDFDDGMDMTIEGLIPESAESAAKVFESGAARLIFENLDKEPTCTDLKHRKMVTAMQNIFRKNPLLVDVIDKEMVDNNVYNSQDLGAIMEQTVVDVNEFLQGYRVLCVTDNKNSLRMWEGYAAGHTGVVVRITPSEGKDSKFTRFRKIIYAQTRPTLFESAEKFRVDILFGNAAQRNKDALDRIFYAKTLKFEFEKEYRLIVALGPGENYDTMPYHPEEVSELYLGVKMNCAEQKQITLLARSRNPEIQIFQTSIDGSGNMVFSEFNQ